MLMKSLTLTLIILTTSMYQFGFAQSKNSIGISLSYDYTMPFYNHDFLSYGERSGIGSQIGFRFKHDFDKNYSLITGLQYQLHATTMNTSYSYITLLELYKTEATFKNNIFQMPILFSAYFGNQLKFGFTFGPTLSYITNNRVTGKTIDVYSGTSKSLNSNYRQNNFYIGSILAIGAEYSIENITVRVEPNFTSSVASFNKYDPEIWSAGIGLSMFYRLK